MYCKIRVKAGIFYGIILIGIIFTVFIFVFSPKGFGNLDSKKELLKIRKEKIAELNREKRQITSNIEITLKINSKIKENGNENNRDFNK
jgi:hypothetical protein